MWLPPLIRRIRRARGDHVEDHGIAGSRDATSGLLSDRGRTRCLEARTAAQSKTKRFLEEVELIGFTGQRREVGAQRRVFHDIEKVAGRRHEAGSEGHVDRTGENCGSHELEHAEIKPRVWPCQRVPNAAIRPGEVILQKLKSAEVQIERAQIVELPDRDARVAGAGGLAEGSGVDEARKPLRTGISEAPVKTHLPKACVGDHTMRRQGALVHHATRINHQAQVQQRQAFERLGG